MTRPLPLLVAAGWAGLGAAEPAGTEAFFEARIRPVLAKHCYECHSVAAGKAEGGLRLDSREGLRSGGDSGPALVPGDPAQSRLLTAVSHRDPDLQMPPDQPPLPAAVIADLEAWIAAGAPDPRTGAAETPAVDPAAARASWCYQPPRPPALPALRRRDWPRRDLDRFVLARLEAENLEPAADAAPGPLLRRLHFDLTGLPPTPAQAAAFTLEKFEATVDALLASPDFGVRWGRHWLDVARYAESNGRESNLSFPHAWRYRDYVIDAVHADVPYDRFITEQIAGDLLPASSDAERARLLIATGFLAFGPKGLNEMNPAQFAADVADEQLDAVMRAVMASSVACARCHDHKTEPFDMEDYYALAGIFKSTQTFYGNWIDSENNNHGRLIRLPELPGQLIPNKPLDARRVQDLQRELADMAREEREEQARAARARAEGRELKIDYFTALQKAIGRYWKRGSIEGQLERVDAQGRALPLCMGVQDGPVRDSALHERGETARPGRIIPRGFPKAIALAGAPVPPATRSGRLELARWLTDPRHPLTARVMVNRIWRHLFGAGLVRTVDQFGLAGEPPSHPELLDHLALRFIDSGWSVKALVREIVLSRSYRMASAHRAEAFARDPDNRLLWRAHKRRLDAEVIRDSMLAVAGRLDPSRRPGSLVAELDGQSVSLIGFNDRLPADLDGSRHRAIYLPILRDHLPDVLEQFDLANPSLVSGDRDVTNVPLQALYLLNGAFVREQADALARRLQREAPDEPARLRHAFQLCFNRAPETAELDLARQFLEAARRELAGAPDLETRALAGFCQALLASGEFRHAD